MRLRQSELKVWMSCPLQAHLSKTTSAPRRQNAKASFGTIVHHCLEKYNQGASIESAVDLFKDLWYSPEKIGAKPDVWPKYTTYGSLREKGIEILNQYHDKSRWENRTVIASEHRFLVPFGEHELEGTVDHIEFKKAGNGQKTLIIGDFKTNSKQPTLVELRLNIQFTVYIYASLQKEFWIGNGAEFPGIPDGENWFEKLEKVKRRGVWYHLMTNKEINAGERDDDDFMRLYRLATEIEKAQAAQVFVPNIGEACVFCDFTEHCKISIPQYEELVEEVL